MALRVVRLGSPRIEGEGLRIGTVRRPPRGVKKERYAAEDWYDVWLPALSPSPELVKSAQAASSEADWATFRSAFRRELARPDAQHLLGLLAALSHRTDLSVGCYCEDEDRCHRRVLREELGKLGAVVR